MDASLTDDVLMRLSKDPTSVALRRQHHWAWRDVTVETFHRQILQAARALIGIGVTPGDRVALLSRTRYEWTVLDYAIWWVGGVSVPIYETSSAEQVDWILRDSEPVLVLVENEDKRQLVTSTLDPKGWHVPVILLDEVTSRADSRDAPASDAELESRRRSVTPESPATIIYTSGTTGRPKGCVLTHANFDAELDSIVRHLPELFTEEGGSTILFLPLAHVFARLIQLGTIRFGIVLCHLADMARLQGTLTQIRPTFLLGVPRVFEKLYDAAAASASNKTSSQWVFDLASRAAIDWSRHLDGARTPRWTRAAWPLFNRLVYRRIRAALGGNLAYPISGGAPLGVDLAHFYRGIGLPIIEGYGMTETSGAITAPTARAQRIGTVGLALPDTELRLTDQGELLVRGSQVARRYWGAAANVPMIDDSGWLHTGDLASIDVDGFVTITGRAKEIIVTAGGKNVAPGPLEDRLRRHPLIDQCMVVGDGRSYVAAMITLVPGAWQGALDDPELLRRLQDAVDDANASVSRAEAIRRFTVIDADWSIEEGFLTPSLKLRRHAIAEAFAPEVERLYTP